MQAIPKDLAKKLPISADAKKKKYSAEKIACFRRCMKKVGVKAQKECLKKCMTDKKKEVKSTDKIKQQKDKTKDKTTAKPERRSGGRGGGGGGGGGGKGGGGAPRVRQPPIVPTQPTAQRTMQPPPLVTLKAKAPKEPKIPKIPAPIIRVPDFSKRKKPSAKDLQRMEDEVAARHGAPAPAPAGGVNPFRPSQSLDTNMRDGTPIPQEPLPASPEDVLMGMATPIPTPVRTPSPPDVRMGTPLPASDYGTDDEVTNITTPAPRDDSPSVANVFFVHPTSRGRPKRQQRTANARAQQLAQANVNVALGAGTPAQEALVDSSIVNQQRHNMISATREMMSSIPADRASPPAQPHSLQSSPVQSHPEMTQIPGARSSTSAYQGHNVDEPEALELALARSMTEITDGQVAGTTPARVALKERRQDFNSRRRNTVAGTQQSARDATVDQRRRQNTHTRAMANARRVAQAKADELSQGAFNLARAKATVRAVDNQIQADNLQRAQQAVRVADAQIQARQAADVVTARIKDAQLQTQASIAQTLGGRKRTQTAVAKPRRSTAEEIAQADRKMTEDIERNMRKIRFDTEANILAEYSASVRNKAHRGFRKRSDSLENVDALLTNFARTPTPPSQSRGSLDDDLIGDWDGTPSPASTEPYIHSGDTPSPNTLVQTMVKRTQFQQFARQERAKLQDFAKGERAKLESRYTTVPAIRYIGNSRIVGNGAGNGAGAVDRGDYIDNTSNHQEEEKEEYDQQEFKSAE